MAENTKLAKSGQNGIGKVENRAPFWSYCQRAAAAARGRAIAKNIPYAIDAYFIDRLLVDRKWRCALSGLALDPAEQGPFSPTLDRIDPPLGYVAGNVRVVCQIINMAMSSWGLEPVQKLLLAMVENGKLEHPAVTARLAALEAEVAMLRAEIKQLHSDYVITVRPRLRPVINAPASR